MPGLPSFPTRRLGAGCRGANAWLWLVLLTGSGCQSLPFAPRYLYTPVVTPEQWGDSSRELVWADARPNWQKRYWQGAETPRDHELGISLIPLERLSPRVAPEQAALLTRGDRAPESAAGEVQGVLARVVRDHPEVVPPTRFELTSFVVVVNKQAALQRQWEESADDRREALSRWRQGPALRPSLGLAGGFGPGLGPTQMGAGLMVGAPAEIPLLPGERPVARVYGAVRGPPPELGPYGPDVTCELIGQWEVTSAGEGRRSHELRATSRSLPLEPPHLLPDQAIAAGVRQLLRLLEQAARQALGEASSVEAPDGEESEAGTGLDGHGTSTDTVPATQDGG